jgi:hypothetical protein
MPFAGGPVDEFESAVVDPIIIDTLIFVSEEVLPEKWFE